VLCVFGIVEMFEGWFAQVPMPLIGGTIPKWDIVPVLRARKSSLVVLLAAGDCDESEKPLVRPVCNMPSMRLRCSRISLSPASSLIPGSRYMHSALSSVHSLHFGLVPSQRDFLDRHISHYRMSVWFCHVGAVCCNTAMVARRRG
jgi:hypothetical protein